ncbi:hypothetical protein Bbelb_089610 [Branchiostoma belcheri]|nr:hypothetical protein Bbelb_089610 [Branchiostoma belcheri]
MTSSTGLKRRIEDTGTSQKKPRYELKRAEDFGGGRNTFDVYPVSRFDLPFPNYRQPSEVGVFSLDTARDFHNDGRKLRYYVVPPDPKHVNFDLTEGYDTLIKRDEDEKEHLDHILRWILKNRRKFVLARRSISSSSETGEQETGAEHARGDSQLHTDFIAWRGHFTKLLCTPYENQDGWTMAVSKFNGTWYISEVETPEQRDRRVNMADRQRQMTYWGYKFEQYLTAAEPRGKTETSDPVNTNEAFCTVIRTRLNTHSLVFSGEVDCRAADDHMRAPQCYIELKTSREMFTPQQQRNFRRYKLLKWWAQSFLPGVPRIVCGFRDDSGVVHFLETFKTMEIPNIIKADSHTWNPSVCVNFCDQFLSHVKKVVQEDNCRLVYLFTWRPNCPVTHTVHRDSEYSFLPDWYTQAFHTTT